MTYERDPVSIDDARAQAAERLLERKRMGLESAVEVLEVLGHRVVQRDDGTYAVRPPYVKPETEEEPLKPQTEAVPTRFLDDHPKTLSVVDVSEITGMHPVSVHKLCRRGELPHAKSDGKLFIPKQPFLAMFQGVHDV